jgi:hypothetical protein
MEIVRMKMSNEDIIVECEQMIERLEEIRAHFVNLGD